MDQEQPGQHQRGLSVIAENALQYSLCNAIKFCYGYFFGTFLWVIIIQPYGRFIDFERGSYFPEFIFSLSSAFIFMTFLWARTIMALFLPSMIGNATQNYIIVLLFVALFTNPVANVTLNAVESVRVIGCSLTMTFEQLTERAKLILSPVFEVLNDRDSADIAPIRKELLNIQQIVVEMRREAEFSRNFSENYPIQAPRATDANQPAKTNATWQEVAEDIGKRLNLDSNKSMEIVNKTRDFIQNTTLQLDPANLGFKASFDAGQLSKLLRANLTGLGGGSLGEFNLTQIMFENCLGIFRRAKSSCQLAVEDMRMSCVNTIGSFLAALWCSPITVTLGSTCPWIMDQLLDENSLCNKMRESSVKLRVDPFNVTGGGDINAVYKNLTEQVKSLQGDLLSGLDSKVPQRIELSISFNDQTKSIFFDVANLIAFISDKYRMRRFFLDILLFVYELYTTITFVVIMMQAYQYRKKYLNQIRFDNHYITGQFIKLDERRRALGKTSILPLTKDENTQYISTFTFRRRTHEEKKTQRASCASILAFLVFTLILLYFDDVFYSILASIHEHALVRFREIGHHALDVRVIGEGVIARLVKRLTGQLSSVYDLNRRTSTRQCLPKPSATSSKFYLEFAYLILAYLIIDQLSIYAMRLRRLTSAFFYPEKERQRIKFLHSLIRIKRQSAKRSGLQSSGKNSEGEQGNENEDEEDEGFFTLRDALLYISDCITDSIFCCRHSVSRIRRPKRQASPQPPGSQEQKRVELKSRPN